MSGALSSIVPVPDEAKLKEYTAQVYQQLPVLGRATHVRPAPRPKTAVPTTRRRGVSPIKYVIYVIKENRTYDQVFGDLAAGPNKKGNGDPTPVHVPAEGDAEPPQDRGRVRAAGQPVLQRPGQPRRSPVEHGMAYHTDYIARDWHLTYSGRKGVPDDDDDGDLANAPSGYLWDACKRERA